MKKIKQNPILFSRDYSSSPYCDASNDLTRDSNYHLLGKDLTNISNSEDATTLRNLLILQVRYLLEKANVKKVDVAMNMENGVFLGLSIFKRESAFRRKEFKKIKRHILRHMGDVPGVFIPTMFEGNLINIPIQRQ